MRRFAKQCPPPHTHTPPPRPKPLCVAAVATDEEIGGFDGAKFCFADAEGPHITCDVCHCPDGGDGFKIVTHEKGVLRLKLIADGHNAHSAYPWHGKNAIQHLMHDLKALENVCVLVCNESLSRTSRGMLNTRLFNSRVAYGGCRASSSYDTQRTIT